MIKSKPPYPIETIGVAIAFSPRMEALLSEAKRLADLFGSKLVLIHVGRYSEKKRLELNALMEKLGMDTDKAATIWKAGHPVETILQVCKEHIVDLLVAGALEKENLLRYYVGSVSREICRRAKCSVLMLTEPSVSSRSFRKIVVNGIDHPKTIHTIGTALYIARRDKSDEVVVVKEIHTPTLALTTADESTGAEAEKFRKELIEEESNKMQRLLSNLDTGQVNVNTRTIFGKPGYSISQFARTSEADLLVINSPDTHLTLLDRIFTHDIEYVLADIPCNLLIVHSRI